MKIRLGAPIIRYVICCCMLTVFIANSVSAQKSRRGTSSDNCQLDEAKKWYEEGALEKIETIEECAQDPKSMSREKRLEALELITESYLYRDKIGAADKSFKSLLRVDPLYQPDTIGDSYQSYDLIYLSRTYTRQPIFSMYFGGGLNFSLIEQLQNYGVDNTSGAADHEGYLNKIVFGGNATIGFDLPLLYNFDLTLDLTFSYRTYAFGDSLYLSANTVNPTGQINNNDLKDRGGSPLLYSTLNFKENQLWLDIPLMLRYNITKFKGLMPYVYAGVAANFLLHAELAGIERNAESETSGKGGSEAAARTITITKNGSLASMRNTVNVSFVAGAGMKFRLGRNFLYVDFRYNRMFLNNVDINNRYANPILLYQYGHVDNDFRTDNFALTVGFIKAFYVPRKKREHNPFIISNKYNKWLEKERNYIKKETDEDLKRELNSTIKEMEREKPSLIEDIQKGRTKGTKMIESKKKEIEDIKNKRVKVDVKYE
ncbi:PorT family protein [Aureispira anguillae]|uniref:PorT family protein n=1 Tax=Aureispira anguillae TaxID=2864201 RepID=A0A915YHX3_9BACT|nr:PorT family protein [Aureispira anguillae]BDS13505.1 PorT family protein [Aureispira anguillae]